MWDPREPPTWWILALVMVVLAAIVYMVPPLPRWTPWIPLGLAFLFFVVGVLMRSRYE
jgi:hypothetical protein